MRSRFEPMISRFENNRLPAFALVNAELFGHRHPFDAEPVTNGVRHAPPIVHELAILVYEVAGSIALDQLDDSRSEQQRLDPVLGIPAETVMRLIDDCHLAVSYDARNTRDPRVIMRGRLDFTRPHRLPLDAC